MARLIVRGPMRPMGVAEGAGTWAVSVRIGSGSDDTHEIDVPESSEIVY